MLRPPSSEEVAAMHLLHHRTIWVLLGAIAASLAVAVPSASASGNGCSVNIQNPHYSVSHGGIDTTAVWTCSLVPTTIEFGFYFLWVCPTNDGGAKDETWITNNCTFKGSNDADFTITVAGSNGATDRVVPPKSNPAAHGTGWWISCSNWRSNGPAGTSGWHLNFSNWAYVSG